MTEPPKVFAIVARRDYPELRRLIPGLPAEFCAWIERRYGERHAYEARCPRYAEFETICPFAFGRDLAGRGGTPTESELDAFATRIVFQAVAPPLSERARRHA